MTQLATDPTPSHSGRIHQDASPGKFFVPPAAEWDTLVEITRAFVTQRALVAPLAFVELEDEVSRLLETLTLPVCYREFLIVLINNEIWRAVVASIPFERRTLMLPPCLRDARSCKAEFDEYGLLCEQCGGCCIGNLSEDAEKLGYAVLVAEGNSIVSTLIQQGSVDAVIGVSCMPSLERTFPDMADKAVPGMAIPLLQEGCENTLVLENWVREFVRLESKSNSDAFLDLNSIKETVQTWFAPGDLAALLGSGASDTETISIEWLSKSGKRWRPFLVAAVYEALQTADGGIPEAVRTTAIAVECIHKASLVYDDIQDSDEKRYGERTVHEEHGVPVALTVALYLLGQGYRLIAQCGAAPEIVNAMLTLSTHGHCELCLGQGAELCWMRTPEPLSADEVLDIFRYKTAPSFEVVFGLGALLGNATPDEHEIIRQFSLAIGVAYQIQDDLDDYTRGGDVDDVKKRRPSIVLAIAHDRAVGDEREALTVAWCTESGGNSEEARGIVSKLGAESTARELLETHKTEALAALRPLKNRNLKILLHRIVGKVFK